jgi:hypothetical protein
MRGGGAEGERVGGQLESSKGDERMTGTARACARRRYPSGDRALQWRGSGAKPRRLRALQFFWQKNGMTLDRFVGCSSVFARLRFLAARASMVRGVDIRLMKGSCEKDSQLHAPAVNRQLRPVLRRGDIHAVESLRVRCAVGIGEGQCAAGTGLGSTGVRPVRRCE